MTPENIQLALQLIPIETLNTLYMVFASAFIAFLIGFPLGIILTITDKGHILENSKVHNTLGVIVNIGRSFPFAILMVALIPFTRFIVGTSLGTTAAIVPLSIAAAPFLARMVELALNEVDKHLIEAAIVMGSTTTQMIKKVLIPESLPSIVLGITTTIVCLVGYTAMAGVMGGGGLGKVAIQYGYQRFNVFLMVVTVIVLIIMVQAIQWIGNRIARKIIVKRGKDLNS
jgi:D-methionine transport system permease protein